MIAIAETLDPTRLCGIAAYGSATLACMIAWSRTKRAGARLPLALILALIYTVLLLDIIFNWRWMLHQFFVNAATREGVYGQRREPQATVLVILFGIFLTACVLALRRLHGRGGAVLAAWGVLFAASLWLVEVISLHQVDHILYRRVGSLLCVSFLWIAACLMTSIGILVEAHRAMAIEERSGQLNNRP